MKEEIKKFIDGEIETKSEFKVSKNIYTEEDFKDIDKYIMKTGLFDREEKRDPSRPYLNENKYERKHKARVETVVEKEEDPFSINLKL